ncbi:MAG TPA: hypothetical protein ENH28_00270 [Euryarchaeota archaeon]|nr:hypothetical protein BMS3Bbin15_00613 [archaeon BMS3Bbin15]HDL14589.1 hypothetical protein [Euryarchaeota archaeon]
MNRVVDIPKEAETVADVWVHNNFKEVMGVNYGMVAKHGKEWEVVGEIEIMAGLFETKRVSFEMKINTKGEILEIKQE